VADPQPHPRKGPGQRVLARVNRRIDILEWERSHDRISDDAYREGRVVQWMFERAGLSGGSTWREGSRVDAEIAKELAILRHIAAATTIDDYMGFMRDALGEVDAAIVRQVLGENRGYGDVEMPRRRMPVPAAKVPAFGRQKPKPGERYASYVARRFRDALETLAAAAAQQRKAKN
jgi:hypothetical protein